MKMRRIVLAIVHGDKNAEELADDRHDPSLPDAVMISEKAERSDVIPLALPPEHHHRPRRAIAKRADRVKALGYQGLCQGGVFEVRLPDPCRIGAGQLLVCALRRAAYVGDV